MGYFQPGSNVYSEAVEVAAAAGHAEAVELVLLGAPALAWRRFIAEKALYSAASNGHLPVVQMILKEYHVKIDYLRMGYSGVTALYVAATNGFLGITRLLLFHGADPRKSNIAFLRFAKSWESLVEQCRAKQYHEMAALLEVYMTGSSHDSSKKRKVTE